MKTLSPINLTSDQLKDRSRLASEEEKKLFRTSIGQLGWLTSVSRPDGLFMFCDLSTIQSKPQILDLVRANKTIRDLKNQDSRILIKSLNLTNLKLAIFSDASFGNLAGGGSQIGYVIFLHDNNNNSIPIAWSSKKAKRVARSTLTAETLAAVEAVDAGYVFREILNEILDHPIQCIDVYTDNKSLFDASKTSNVTSDKRLLIDLAALREMIDQRQIKMHWLSTEYQLANNLTKMGASKQKLMEALRRGCLTFPTGV